MKNVLNVMMPRQFCENISSAASSILSFVSLAKLSSIHSRVTFRSLIIVNERSLVKTCANIYIDPGAFPAFSEPRAGPPKIPTPKAAVG